MTAGVRLSGGAVKAASFVRNSEARDTDPQIAGKDVVFWRKLVMAVFGEMVALNMSGDTKSELLFQMPRSMEITADATRK